MYPNILFLAVAAVCFQGMTSVVVPLESCSDVPSNKCTMHEVRIDPCRRPGNCVLRRGRSAHISFDFTPDFATSNLQSAVYSKSLGAPLPDMDYDACKFTGCPTLPGQKQTYNYTLNIPRLYSPSTYPIFWWVWNDNDSTQKCCFETTITIR